MVSEKSFLSLLSLVSMKVPTGACHFSGINEGIPIAQSSGSPGSSMSAQMHFIQDIKTPLLPFPAI